jgi:di/tricarboxylate transporter
VPRFDLLPCRVIFLQRGPARVGNTPRIEIEGSPQQGCERTRTGLQGRAISTEQYEFLGILGVGLALFIHGRLRVDVTALLILLALVIAGLLEPNEALAGFASEPAIIVASVFVLSAALSATGVTDRIGKWMSEIAGAREVSAILVIMPTVALLAAFSHHLMVTAMMLPIVIRFAHDHRLPASRLLMPMSLAASLGTTLTLFSAPAFLIADDLLRRQTGREFGIFEITPIGAALVLTGIVYLLLMRWIIPKRTATNDEQDYLRLQEYYTELLIEPESPWSGQSAARFRQRFAKRLELVNWMRDGQLFTGEGDTLHAGDVLLVRISPDELSSIRDEPGLALNAISKYGYSSGKKAKATSGGQLVQVIVGPNSEFAGQSVGRIDFLRTMGVLVVGLWRRESWISEKLSEVRLREGDLLVLFGDPERYTELAHHRGFLMMVPFAAKRRLRHRAPIAVAVMGTVVVLAATGWFSTPIVFLAGAVAMILTRCVPVEQAYSEIDVRIFVMIAGVIPLGAAMQSTGTAQLLANQLLALAGGWDTFTLLAISFGVAAVLTQVLSDAATVALLGPIAIAIAEAVGLAAEPFLVCTTLGAVASFLTPIGHHGNLLIMGPGKYTFGDFFRVGLPLTCAIGFLSCRMSQALWLNGPAITN